MNNNPKLTEYMENMKRLQNMQRPNLVRIARLVNVELKKKLIKNASTLTKSNLIVELMVRHDITKKHINSAPDEKGGKVKKPKFKIDPKTGKIDAKENEKINKKLKQQIKEADEQIAKNTQIKEEFDKKNNNQKVPVKKASTESQKTKKSSSWIEHVKAYQKENNVSYKQAMKDAKSTYSKNK